MIELSMKALLSIENDGWAALCESRGGEFYGNLMTSEGIMVLVNGMVLNRNSVIASLNDSPAWTSYQIESPRLLQLGNEAAALIYRAQAIRESTDPFEALMSSVYVLVEGHPRLVLYQQTTATH